MHFTSNFNSKIFQMYLLEKKFIYYFPVISEFRTDIVSDGNLKENF